MKKTKYILTLLMVSLLSIGFQSCEKEVEEYWVKSGLDMNMGADNVYFGSGDYGFMIDYDMYNTDIWGINHNRDRIIRIEALDAYMNIYGDFIEGDRIELILEADGILGSSYTIVVSRKEEREGLITIDGMYDDLYTDFMYDLIYRVANSSRTRLYITGYTNIVDIIPIDFKFRNKFETLIRR